MGVKREICLNLLMRTFPAAQVPILVFTKQLAFEKLGILTSSVGLVTIWNKQS